MLSQNRVFRRPGRCPGGQGAAP